MEMQLPNVVKMVKSLYKNNQIVGFFLFIFILFAFRHCTCAIYPFPAWGSPYQTADHFWPFQNISGGLVDDVQGAAHTIVYNGGRIKKVDQLGTSLFLDGKDDWVDTGGFNADCVTDPSKCKNGFTLGFWLKVYGSGYIMSSGSFSNSRHGPGFRLVYDTKIKGFEFILETATKRWRVHVQGDTNKWIHMIFSWKESIGIEYYEDGNLSTYSGNKPFYLSARPKRYTPVITLGRPNNVLEVRNFGYFEISQFAIWMKWLSSSDSSGVYLNGVVYDQETAVCCYFKSVGICATNPCYDPKQCKRIDETHRCLCPRVSLRLKTCKEKIKSYCVDQLRSCNIYAKQEKYCRHRKMRDICPRSCDYCAPGSTTEEPSIKSGSDNSADVQGTSPDSKSSKDGLLLSTDMGNHGATRLSSITPTVNPSSSSYVPYVMPSSSMPIYGNITAKKIRRGKDCESLQCSYYSNCIKHNDYAECVCKTSCSFEYAPVCGTNSKTYMNKCVLRTESCIVGRWIRVAKKGSCGSRYPNAAHYWPFNTTSKSRTLLDVRGKCKTLTYNGVRTTYAEQLGPVLSLDGLDDWIFINGVRSKCINDPTLCSRGLTIAFWIKYHAGQFILSGGRYTDDQQGPGFRFVCSNCASASEDSSETDLKAKRFVLNLSTRTQDWKINLDFLPKAWFHFAFTWHIDHGLKVYKNGKLVVKDTKAEKVKYRPLSPRYEIITLGRPNSLSKLQKYGKFDIGHLVIWPYELSAYEVEVAFLTVLAKTTPSLICCHFKKADPCVDNPCYNGASCRSIDEKFQCICPDIPQVLCPIERTVHPCVDQSDTCGLFARQEGYCENNRKYMTLMCAKTCKFCRSLVVARETLIQPEASPSFIDPSVLLTSGIGSRTVVVQPEASRSQKKKTQTLTPTPTPYPTVLQPQFCPLGKGSHQQCVCMNCEGNTANGIMCCIDLLRPKDMNEGITLVVSSLSMAEFLSKLSPLRNLASQIISAQCSKSPCFDDNMARKKRSNGDDISHATPSVDQTIKSWEGLPIVPSNTLKPDIRRNAQPASMAAPRIQRPINVNVVIFKIAKHPKQYQKLYTAFYVSVDGTNETQTLKADTLAKLIRTKRDLFKSKLNISIETVAPWSYWSRTFSIGIRMVPSTAGFPSSYGTTVIPGAGTPNVDGQEGHNSTTNMSKSTFIIVLVTGIGGFVVLAIIIIYMLVKFLRRMKGEFVPDKVYPNEQKSNSGSDQLIPQFIDPSTPRITDVPKKTVRTGGGTAASVGGGGGGGGLGGGGGGSGGGSKKAKKPMGVKVTYKPPKWD